ncbi:hypothetical protein DGI_2463 [Megalodesulfovibrio gigas DSM 1382 = ATCC 19364]|uniref:Uncharacterized protein n=1 Tax=Megalodesulfovibrio gigas (strain ATCC 19364 / DSM 1382 / NCIMB 9332 / VKM B-1759) TaxID=1121448 RepID=T2GDF5_MEGG1|nr:hypothetical protein DGI_2463 [Megalodesulfovibrio gigas DSM 1382 = ATCC 19364]
MPVAAAVSNSTLPPDAAYWIAHLERDLLPYWLTPAATPESGPFPTYRMDDGRAMTNGTVAEYKASAKQRGGQWIIDEGKLDDNYIRTHARQTFAYGVAYHLTGNPRYLALMQQGVRWSMAHAFDDRGAKTIVAGDVERNSQDQAYSVNGLAFYYYLTRDEVVLERLKTQYAYIMQAYGIRNASGELEGVAFRPGETRPTELVAVLDQLNAYMMLLAPILPEPMVASWKQDMLAFCRFMLKHFQIQQGDPGWDPLLANSFWGLLSDDVTVRRSRHLDFGHSVKAWWMIHLAGRLTGDSTLAAQGLEGMRALLAKGYLPGPRLMDWAVAKNKTPLSGLVNEATWAEKVCLPSKKKDCGNMTVVPGQHWWIHCEMDQAAATSAMANGGGGDLAAALALTGPFFVDHFVDRVGKEVWHAIDPITLAPQLKKAHHWKNAYHSFEHALVMAIAGQALRRGPLTLHFALQQDKQLPPNLRPYYFEGTVRNVHYATMPGQDDLLLAAVEFEIGTGETH